MQLLIFWAFPMILISTSSSEYLNYKDHIVTLPHNVQKFEDILQNCPKDITVVSFSLKGKTKNTKVYQVPR